MALGNTKSNKWGLILNPNEKESQNASKPQLKAYLTGLLMKLKDYNGFRHCFSIVHDKDTLNVGEEVNTPTNAKEKTIHTHSFIELEQKVTKTSLLDLIESLLGVERTQITLNPTNNDYLVVQYLTHKNQAEKHQYPIEDIITNDKEEFLRRYDMKYQTPEQKAQELQQDILCMPTLKQLIEKHGIETANKYRNLFHDIKKEANQDFDTLLQVLNRHTRQFEELDFQFQVIKRHLSNTYSREQIEPIIESIKIIQEIIEENL